MPKSAIICVDDEVTVLESLEIELQKAFKNQYLYEFAESADEALEVIEELVEDSVKIVVLVSDWLMPGMKGDELLILIHQRFPEVNTILLTGQADREAVERAINEANIHAYLTKPWNSKELIETIRSGLSKS
jgi:response regulator RpfG family c-di-GMP phosphodiesterase